MLINNRSIQKYTHLPLHGILRLGIIPCGILRLGVIPCGILLMIQCSGRTCVRNVVWMRENRLKHCCFSPQSCNAPFFSPFLFSLTFILQAYLLALFFTFLFLSLVLLFPNIVDFFDNSQSLGAV